MTINKETVEKVIEMTKQGFTQKAIADQLGIPERTQRDWKKKGLLGISEAEEKSQSKDEFSMPKKVNAADLVKAGFIVDKVHIVLSAQDFAIKQGNTRMLDFLNFYIETVNRWEKIPPDWAALIAGFPIIGQDIRSKSFQELALLAKEVHPYISKELRRTYRKRAQPILLGILAEVQAFLQDAATAGGLPLAIMPNPPPNWKDLLPWNTFTPKSYRVDDSLVKGAWGYAIPAKIHEMKVDIKRTWAGFLYDMISRLPDPDKQKGKLLRKHDLMSLIYLWCSTAPQDFKPPLPDINRKPVSTEDHTLAGIYKKYSEEPEDQN